MFLRDSGVLHTLLGIPSFAALEGRPKLGAFEFKYADAPSVTKSLRIAREDLKLRRAFVVHPGPGSYPLEDWAEAVAIDDLHERLRQLVGPPRRGGGLGRQRATSRPRR